MAMYRIVFLFLCLLIVACSNKDTVIVEPKTTLTGDLVGIVTLLDRRGDTVSDRSGVRVECVGTPFSTMTDKLGNWMLHGLTTSTYQLRFSKEGYDSWEDRQFHFISGGVVRYNTSEEKIYLMQFNTAKVILDSLSPSRKLYGHATIDSTYENMVVYTLIYYGKDSNINPLDPASYLEIGVGSITSFYNDERYSKFHVTLNPHTLTYGDTIYIRVFPYLQLSSPYLAQHTIYDPITNKYIQTNLGEGSNAFSMEY